MQFKIVKKNKAEAIFFLLKTKLQKKLEKVKKKRSKKSKEKTVLADGP